MCNVYIVLFVYVPMNKDKQSDPFIHIFRH